ncbi:S1/P1 nuclease [Longimicrobium sp.]|uniref:S1/P1 nuclease n=1 Tax=Longimicrobium sp. TaxID=2029185 RepID=UPI002E2FEF8E|nr:S1/P1 nuclease [Longimicrobium sp.]HEX6040511.1 S1/P1 nuclease [Longimicrobium sp.]
MKLRALLPLTAAATLLWSTPAHAWDELGHRVVARIAWDHMTPAARQNAVRLLQAAPPASGIAELMPQTGTMEERQREWFVWAAVWADMIRDRDHAGARYAHADWHYVNFFWEQMPDGTRRDRPDLPRAGFLIDQMERIGTTLGNPSVPDSAKTIDLMWALHLAGDAHQPLHNNARITPQDPEGDRGGNSFRLAGLYPMTNLHSLWDGLVGFSMPWSPADRSEADYVGSIARRIAAQYPQSRMRGQIEPGEFEEWSREGFRVAQRVAYTGIVRDQRAPASYRASAWNAAEPRLALAGYRLADLLNRTLGS